MTVCEYDKIMESENLYEVRTDVLFCPFCVYMNKSSHKMVNNGLILKILQKGGTVG